jgi:hypothetical protein
MKRAKHLDRVDLGPVEFHRVDPESREHALRTLEAGALGIPSGSTIVCHDVDGTTMPSGAGFTFQVVGRAVPRGQASGLGAIVTDQLTTEIWQIRVSHKETAFAGRIRWRPGIEPPTAVSIYGPGLEIDTKGVALIQKGLQLARLVIVDNRGRPLGSTKLHNVSTDAILAIIDRVRERSQANHRAGPNLSDLTAELSTLVDDVDLTDATVSTELGRRDLPRWNELKKGHYEQ